MTFDTGAKVAADIVEEIANGLIATPEGYWTDADATWTTVTRTANNARRALKYYDGAETIYLALEVINQTNGQNYYYGAQGWWYYGKGIRIVFSKTWDSTGHIYPTTDPTAYQSTFLAFESHSTTTGVDIATTMVTYFLWYENNGFVIMGKPEPTGDSNQQSFIIVVEKIANPVNKEYVDGYSSFFCYTAGNIWNSLYDGNWATTLWRNRTILRPFAYQWPDHTSWSSYSFATTNGNGISFPPMPSYIGYKSIGNGKVYYIKPIINNTPNQLSPIFQSELFFMWNEGLGLIDGDVIAVQGQPVKYLCKALDSPDNTSRLTYAIKYYG